MSAANKDYLSVAKRTIEIESNAIDALRERLDNDFVSACELMLQCQGRVIVTGMGKSHHIGSKIAATLASTGTPAFFVHPGEANHGDLGMITKTDVVIAISNSGSAMEILSLLPILKRMHVPVIAMTGKPNSPLGKAATVVINIGVKQEACPLDLAPTSSTTATLVMGDAMAIALLEARGFTAEDFAFSHPGGALGRKLLVKAQDLMHSGEQLPRVSKTTPVTKALLEMTAKSLGLTTVVDEQDKLLGIFTDGDLRRSLDHGIDISSAIIGDVMTSHPQTIDQEALAAEAFAIMEEKKITALVVADNGQPVGIIHIHDILRAGIV